MVEMPIEARKTAMVIRRRMTIQRTKEINRAIQHHTILRLFSIWG
jgi:hypothetical protein